MARTDIIFGGPVAPHPYIVPSAKMFEVRRATPRTPPTITVAARRSDYSRVGNHRRYRVTVGCGNGGAARRMGRADAAGRNLYHSLA